MRLLVEVNTRKRRVVRARVRPPYPKLTRSAEVNRHVNLKINQIVRGWFR